MVKKNTAQKIMDAAADLSKEAKKRPTDRQVLAQKRKEHPGWSDEQIANRYGLSL